MASKIKFYDVKVDADSKVFAWAMSYGPLPGGMPYLHPLELEREMAFWHLYPHPPGLRIEGGRVWPDFLGHGGGSPYLFVSERVVQTLQEMNLPIARLTEMPIAEIQSKHLENKAPPRYFVLESVPGIEVDFAASGIPTDDSGKPFVPSPLPRPWPPVLRLKAASWNGTDLFRFSNYGNAFRLIITNKLHEIAQKQKWLNMDAEPIWAF